MFCFLVAPLAQSPKPGLVPCEMVPEESHIVLLLQSRSHNKPQHHRTHRCRKKSKTEMAPLPSLPDELLALICKEVHPFGNPSRGDLDTLAALARTNRRLFCFVDPLLYDKSIQCHSHIPLAWAAKFGVVGTLRKALAAGADPNYIFRARVNTSDLEHIGELA